MDIVILTSVLIAICIHMAIVWAADSYKIHKELKDG